MKKLSSIILTLAALSFAAVSCQEEETPYEPGEAEVSGCYGVYFPTQDASGSHTLTPADPTSVDIEVKRSNASGAINVPFVFDSEEDIYTVGQISFADGSETAYLHVDFAAAAPGATHEFSVVIEDPQYASKYFDGSVALDYEFMIVEWKEFVGAAGNSGDLGHIYQMCWEEDYDTQMFYYETSYADIRCCKLVDAWHGNKETVDYVFYWNTSTNNLYIPHQWMGYDLSDGRSVYAGTAPDFYNAYYGWGMTCPSQEYFDWATPWITKNGFFQPYYDGNGNFYLGDWTYLCNGSTPTGSGYQFGADDESGADLFMAPGFIRVDYTFELDLDYVQNGLLPVSLTTGIDVATVKLAGFEGELTATQIANKAAAIASGDEASVSVNVAEDLTLNEDESVYEGTIGLSLPKSSVYTIVAIALDAEGNVQTSESAVAFYVTADDTEEYAVNVTVGAEFVPERYGEYSKTSSFGYYVVGQGVTAANVAVFSTAKYSAAPDTYNAYVKETAELALSEDAVAAINAAGGYYDVVTGLSALTDYTVVVWATNGNEDTFVTTHFTTDGLPNEVICSTGAFGYMIAFAEYDDNDNPIETFDAPLNLEFNPNTGMYEIPNWGYGVNFTFSYDKETGAIDVPTQKTGFANGTYGTLYVGNADCVPQSWIDYFGIDVEPKSYVDESGNFHFYLTYYSSAGYYFGTGYETYYVNGVPSVELQQSIITTGADNHVELGKNLEDGRASGNHFERAINSVEMTVTKLAPKAKSSTQKSLTKLSRKDLMF